MTNGLKFIILYSVDQIYISEVTLIRQRLLEHSSSGNSGAFPLAPIGRSRDIVHIRFEAVQRFADKPLGKGKKMATPVKMQIENRIHPMELEVVARMLKKQNLDPYANGRTMIEVDVEDEQSFRRIKDGIEFMTGCVVRRI